MTIDISDLLKKWENDKDVYSKIGKIVGTKLKKGLSDFEILPSISYRVKDLLSIIKKIKKKQRAKPDYGYNDINDKLGIRVICNFNEEQNKVDEFITNNFLIKKADYKKLELDYNRLDYISNHYDCQIRNDDKTFRSVYNYNDHVFEIQVRTINQNVWSSIAHFLSYKQEAELSPKLKRKVYRLLSLYEIADDEFSSVNNELINLPDNKVYRILRMLEGKIYKYAQVDFDRDTSIYNLRIIFSFLDNEEQDKTINEISNFISENNAKIVRIFKEYKNRFYEMPILTQPEIFLIWYLLLEYPFSIDDNWNNEFDGEELEQIKTAWGCIIK
jgi:putative GTP pyrophosphokinase